MVPSDRVQVHVVDFFSGCGGTSAGLRAAGMKIVLGVDCDADAARTFKLNFPDSGFLETDIRQLEVDDIRPAIEACGDHPLLFCGCAPCQPFSRQRSTKKHPKRDRDLLDHFGRFVAAYTPAFVLCENVPGIQSVSADGGPFGRFLRMLKRKKYRLDYRVIECQDYGVPQMRRRLLLVASRVSDIAIPVATHGPETGNPYSTVADWISGLPRLKAGQRHRADPVHRAAALSELNLKRISATPKGGGRRDWPERLQLRCHTRKRRGKSYRGHTDVYGRMRLDCPAPALTTRCISLSNGRYGHPTQDRAISTREAACLQTFPRDFKFAGSFVSIGRQIGNAVPVLVAEKVGKAFLAALHRSVNGDIQSKSARAGHARPAADR